MDSSALEKKQTEKGINPQYIVISCMIMLLAFASITNGSLWGDEICRVFDPISGDIAATVHTALGYAQPGYMLYMFVWTRLAGGAEFALRCSNLPWVVVGIVYAFKIVRSRNWSPWWTLAFFLHPMFVYYMDEATPYIVVHALSLAFLYYLWFSNDFDSSKNIICINAVYLLGVFMHFMYGFIIMLYFTKCAMRLAKQAKMLLKHMLVMLCFSPAYGILLYLYAKNLLGNTGTGFGVKSLAYIPYSFLGMQGAGLSRNDLRAGNFNHITMWQITLLAAFVIVLLCLFFAVVRDKIAVKQFFKQDAQMLAALVAYFAVIFAAASLKDLGLWERHCMPAFPVFIICMVDLWHLVSPKSALFRAAVVGYAILLAISCANLRGNYYYACDDYKGMTEAVAAWLAEDAAHTVVTAQKENEFPYYSYLGAAADPKKQIVNVYGRSQEEIQQCFEALPPADAMLLLFEKDCSRQLYTCYDDRNDFEVEDRYNSFKLIKPAA